MDFTFFEIVGEIHSIEIIAVKTSIKVLKRLNQQYGNARWRKLKGIATVKLSNGRIHLAEVHWYEAHGIGKRKIKIKKLLD